MSRKLITKKFELTSESDAKSLTKKLNTNKYKSIQLGSAVISACRQTKKLDTILKPFKFDEIEPNEYDLEQLENI